MIKENCWEQKQCGRQPGGEKAHEFGICPVATHTKAHGINNGINGGRACWAVEGTFCGGEVQGTFAQKMGNCMDCDFYNQVRQEEGPDYKGSKEIINKLNGSHKTSQPTAMKTDTPIKLNASKKKS